MSLFSLFFFDCLILCSAIFVHWQYGIMHYPPWFMVWSVARCLSTTWWGECAGMLVRGCTLPARTSGPQGPRQYGMRAPLFSFSFFRSFFFYRCFFSFFFLFPQFAIARIWEKIVISLLMISFLFLLVISLLVIFKS